MALTLRFPTYRGLSAVSRNLLKHVKFRLKLDRSGYRG